MSQVIGTLNKLCCVVNSVITCHFCEYTTCFECMEADDHTLGDIVRKVDIWYCPVTMTLLRIERTPEAQLLPFVPTLSFYGEHKSNLFIQTQILRSKPRGELKVMLCP